MTAPAMVEKGLRTDPIPAAERRRGFWTAAYTLFVLLMGTNLPTPLYRSYGQEFGFSPLVVTLVFAAYVGALVPSLLVVGPLSDALGRRRVLLPAVGVAMLGALAFALASTAAWLLVARILQGLAIGAAAGVLTATLGELAPGGRKQRAVLVSTLASLGGLGAGPLVAGVLAQYAPAPFVLPYAVEIVLLAAAGLALWRLPETLRTRRWRPQRPTIPAGLGRVFAMSGSASFLTFAVMGLFLSLVPAYATELSGSSNLAVAGGVVTLMLASSLVAQLLTHRLTPARLEIAGMLILAAGLGLLALAGSGTSLPILLFASVTGGIGHGLVFLGSLSEINRAAPDARRADTLSSYYVAVYLGLGLPVIGVGFLATRMELLPAVQVFAAGLAPVCLLHVTLRTLRELRLRRGGATTAQSAARPASQAGSRKADRRRDQPESRL